MHVDADHLAHTGETHEVFVIFDEDDADDVPGFGGEFHGDDPFACAALLTVLIGGGAFTQPFFADDEDLVFFVFDCGGTADVVVVDFEFDGGDPTGYAADLAGIIDFEADALSLFGRDKKPLGFGFDDFGFDNLIVLVEVDCAHAIGTDVAVFVETGAFDDSVAGEKHKAFACVKVGRGDDRHDLLIFLEVDEIDHRFAFGGAGTFGDAVDFEPVELTPVGNEHQRIVGVGDEEFLDEVVFVCGDGDFAFASTTLFLILFDRHPLDVATVGDGDDHWLVGDEILDVDVVVIIDDLGTALFAKRGFDFGELFADDLDDFRFALEDPFEVGDEFAQFGQFVLDLFDLQTRQAAQAHLEDRFGLDFAEAEAAHEVFASIGIVGAGTDDFDHFVDVVHGDLEPFEDVGAGTGFFEVEDRTADDDRLTMVDKQIKKFTKVEDFGLFVDDGEHDDPKGRLHLGGLEQVIQDDLTHRIALELDNDPDPLAVGLIPDFADAVDLLVADELGDVFDETGFVDLIGEFIDDNHFAVFVLFDVGFGTHFDSATPGGVGIDDPFFAEDHAAGGEIGAFDSRHHLFDARLGVVQTDKDRIDQLIETVRGDVGRHTDGDPG